MPVDMTANQRKQALLDRARYEDLLAVAMDEISQHEVDTFILKVTGHARYWLASWEYQKLVQEFMASNGDHADEMRELLDASYVEAISNLGLL